MSKRRRNVANATTLSQRRAPTGKLTTKIQHCSQEAETFPDAVGE